MHPEALSSTKFKVAVAIGAYNEEKDIGAVIEALLSQTYPLEQIVITDDGSTDGTGDVVKEFTQKDSRIKVISQKNAGPAAARNRAWEATDSKVDIIAFTDGNTIPDDNWLEELVKPFDDPGVGGAGGAYRTLNTNSVLARFFGLEIAWRYSQIVQTRDRKIDAHGTYNLAIRRKIMVEVGGFDETYKEPSGEDWDLTYKVSRMYKLIFAPRAIVATEHPQNIYRYLKTQRRRGYDRIMLYIEHPEQASSDNYSGRIIKYQIWVSGMLIPALIFFYPIFPYSYLIPAAFIMFLIIAALLPFPYFVARDISVAIFSVPIQLIRNYAWFLGMIQGMLKFGFMDIVRGVIKSG